MNSDNKYNNNKNNNKNIYSPAKADTKQNSLKDLTSYSINDQLKILGIKNSAFTAFYEYLLDNKEIPNIGYIPASDREKLHSFFQTYKIITDDNKLNDENLLKFKNRNSYENLSRKNLDDFLN